MIEKEMEDLLWDHAEKFLNEQLTQFERQSSSSIGRSDLIFVDRIERFLVVEVKKGKLQRGAIEQLHDYYGMMKRRFPDKVVELMVIANQIPQERRLACEKLNIDTREISEKKFRDVASEVNYVFKSEVVERESEKAQVSETARINAKNKFNGSPLRPRPVSSQTAIRLSVSPEDALRLLRQVPHENFRNTLGTAWQENQDGNIRAQSICWFFCWAKTGNHSLYIGDFCKSIFNKIFDKTYEWFDSKVDHEWARKARYKKRSIEAELQRILSEP